MAKVKLRCITECPGLKSSYREIGLLLITIVIITAMVKFLVDLTPVIVSPLLFKIHVFLLWNKNHNTTQS